MPRFEHASWMVAFACSCRRVRLFFFNFFVPLQFSRTFFFSEVNEKEHIIKAHSRSYNKYCRSFIKRKKKRKTNDHGNKELKRRFETTFLMMTFFFELKSPFFRSRFGCFFLLQCAHSVLHVSCKVFKRSKHRDSNIPFSLHIFDISKKLFDLIFFPLINIFCSISIIYVDAIEKNISNR